MDQNDWNQWKELGKNLNAKVDELKVALEHKFDETNARIDQTNQRLEQTTGRIDQTNARLDQTNARLDQTNARLDQTNARLEALCTLAEATNRLAVATNERLEQTRIELKAELVAVRTATSEGFALVARSLARRDEDIADLRSRLTRVEEHVGLR